MYVCDDESFEADLDINFQQAFEVLKQLGIPDLNEENFMARPEEEDPNQDAYNQDDEEKDSDEDDLDIF